MSADAILFSKYKKNRPENAFREVVSTREVYGEKWRIFRGQKFSGVLRNTRKSFRELCGAVSGPEWKTKQLNGPGNYRELRETGPQDRIGSDRIINFAASQVFAIFRAR